MMIFDMHNDVATAQMSLGQIEKYFSENSNNKIVSVIWTTKLDDPLNFINDYIGRMKNQVIAIEDLGFLTLDDIVEIVKLPIFYVGLVWNEENRLSGGAFSDSGMTTLGLAIAKILDLYGIAIDTAHMSRKGFYDLAEKNVCLINSHCCMDSVSSHPRNLTDEQIKIIIDLGGIIGLTMCADFMGKRQNMGTRFDYIKQIDRFVQKFGVKNLCIGTDFFGTAPLAGLSNYNDIEECRCELCKIGLSQSDIADIFYNNANDFYEKKLEDRKLIV